MPAKLPPTHRFLSVEDMEQAFAIRHSSWNRIRVFLGPNAEDKATRWVVDTVLAGLGDDDRGLPHLDAWFNADKVKPTQEQYDETYAWLEDNDYLDDWDIFADARIAWEDGL